MSHEATPAATPARTIRPVTTGATAGAAAAIVLVYVVEQLTGLDVPGAVEGAVAILLTAGGGFLVKPRVGG